jgi:hypothetical protein
MNVAPSASVSWSRVRCTGIIRRSIVALSISRWAPVTNRNTRRLSVLSTARCMQVTLAHRSQRDLHLLGQVRDRDRISGGDLKPGLDMAGRQGALEGVPVSGIPGQGRPAQLLKHRPQCNEQGGGLRTHLQVHVGRGPRLDFRSAGHGAHTS